MSRLFAALLLLVLMPAGVSAQPLPEAATGRTERPEAQAETAMVVAANPLAAQAGRDILKAGGSAVDAAIAAQLVLNLVEPQSSGFGGGAFLLVHDAKSGGITTFDGRETAPAAARPDRFLDAQGKPMAFRDAVLGGRSVGVPGLLAALKLAHEKHGKLLWARLFEPAVGLAEVGFPMSPRLHALLADNETLPTLPATRALYYGGDGKPVPVGAPVRNTAFADTLRLIAEKGPDVFYRGKIARDIVATVRDNPLAAGDLSEADLAAYRAVERPAVCAPYRTYTVCGMGPPSSGGIAVAQALRLLERSDFADQPPMSAAAVHRLAQAEALAFADRNLYVADADFVPVPVSGLLAGDYLDDRATLMGPRLEAPYAAGRPEFRWPWSAGAIQERPGTTQVSVIDADGNAVSMTSSIEGAFGSHLMVRGLLLNNELTDFAFMPVDDGRPVANRVEPGKRPRSSMAPTMVFGPDGRLRLITGSPGGSAIIPYVVQQVVAILDWNMGPQAAAALPRVINRNGPTDVEAGTDAEALTADLTALGHEVRSRDLNSGVHSILVGPRGLRGGVDPRREGLAAGY